MDTFPVAFNFDVLERSSDIAIYSPVSDTVKLSPNPTSMPENGVPNRLNPEPELR